MKVKPNFVLAVFSAGLLAGGCGAKQATDTDTVVEAAEVVVDEVVAATPTQPADDGADENCEADVAAEATPHPVAHWEICAENIEEVIAFYTALFGWETQYYEEMDYTMALTNGPDGMGVSGGFCDTGGEFPGHLTVYTMTDDLDASVAAALVAGADMLAPLMPVEGVGTMAMMADPSGATFALMEPSGPIEEYTTFSDRPVVYWEIIANNAEETVEFYETLFGWESELSPMPGYWMLASGAGFGIHGGIGQAQSDEQLTNGIKMYVAVPSIEDALARAAELGATDIVGPMTVTEGVTIGSFAGPAGNHVGLFLHNPAAE